MSITSTLHSCSPSLSKHYTVHSLKLSDGQTIVRAALGQTDGSNGANLHHQPF